jgi:Fic family protein
VLWHCSCVIGQQSGSSSEAAYKSIESGKAAAAIRVLILRILCVEYLLLTAVLTKARFWEANASVAMNDRQRLVLNRLLDGFEGKLTTSKYAKLTKCSQDTALRDILPLVELGILVRNPEGGRSTSYALAIVAPDLGFIKQ